MKKILIITCLLTSYMAKGQGIHNELSFEEWNNIKINGVTLERIGLTNGDTEEIKLLFGGTPKTFDHRHEHEPNPAIYHRIKGVSFGFEGESEDGVFLLTSIKIRTNQAVVEICGKTISLGQPISNLGSVKFNTRTSGEKNIIYIPVKSDDPFLVIEFDQVSKIVTRIYYFELT